MRRGAEMVIKPNIVVINEIELLKFKPEEIAIMMVACSKGTYIHGIPGA